MLSEQLQASLGSSGAAPRKTKAAFPKQAKNTGKRQKMVQSDDVLQQRRALKEGIAQAVNKKKAQEEARYRNAVQKVVKTEFKTELKNEE